MSSKTKWIIIGAVAVLAIIVLLLNINKNEPQEPVVTTPKAKIEKKSDEPVETEKVYDRIHPREIICKFVMTGKGSHANWGKKGECDFICTYNLIVNTKIISKERLDNGGLKVVEEINFESVKETITTSNGKLALALDTLPLDEVANTAKLFAKNFLPERAAEITTKGVEWVHSLLKKVDNTDITPLLKYIAPNIKASSTKSVEETMKEELQQFGGCVRRLEGKTFVFTHYQDEKDCPLYLNVVNKDGSAITEEEEIALLRINSFIDYYTVPDTNCKIGDSWTIAADKIEQVFDPYVDGKYTGDVTVKRVADDPNGLWKLDVKPCQLKVVSNGTTTGSIKLDEGYAKIAPKHHALADLQIKGRANMNRLNPHHLLFKVKIAGECDFVGHVISTVKDDN